MPIVAQGQLTIVDLNDAASLYAFIQATNASDSILFNPNTGQYTPDWTSTNLVLTPNLSVSNITGEVITNNNNYPGTATPIKNYVQSVTWKKDGVVVVADANHVINATTKTLTFKLNPFTSATSMNFSCDIVWRDPDTGQDITVTASKGFSKVTLGADGAASITGTLSNESATVGTDSAGNGGTYTNATSTISIYQGSTDITSTYAFTATPSAGITGTASGTPANRTYTLSGMTTDNGTVTFVGTRSGFATITKVFSISKNKQGTAPTNYDLQVTPLVISRNPSGVMSPTSVTLTAKSQTGSAAIANYSGRFTVEESTDGTNYGTAKYTSSADQNTYTYSTITAGTKFLRFRLYMAGGTTTLVDEQIVPIMDDGADPIVTRMVTANGDTITNGDMASLKAKIEVYKGSSLATPSAYAWLIRDSSVTTSASAGWDADVGAGWRTLANVTNADQKLAISGATTSEITIGESFIPSVANLKAKATLGSAKYYQDVTFRDIVDPIRVTISSSVGELFKNGVINSTLSVKIEQNGIVIPWSGLAAKGMSAVWKKYDATGTLVAGFAPTVASDGSIAITANDVTSKAIFSVEVSK